MLKIKIRRPAKKEVVEKVVIEKAAVKKVAKKTAKKVPAKKAAKKTTAKKATVKKTPTKKVAKNKVINAKILVCADAAHCFWTTDGQILNSLVALANSLETMNKDVFNYHVTKERNDFAAWVKEVLKDNECAKDLSSRRTPKAAHSVITRHLKKYQT